MLQADTKSAWCTSIQNIQYMNRNIHIFIKWD